MLNATHLGIFAIVFAVLVAVVNILTQIFKSFLAKKEIPTRVFVVIASIVLTVVTFVAACQICTIQILWYMIFASVVVGFIVAYCAMFGYDNLYGELKALMDKVMDYGNIKDTQPKN